MFEFNPFISNHVCACVCVYICVCIDTCICYDIRQIHWMYYVLWLKSNIHFSDQPKESTGLDGKNSIFVFECREK